jgi:hypothetical protein
MAQTESRQVSNRGVVGATFAAVIMIIAGIFGVLQGIILLARGAIYVQPPGYWINTSASTWGWWHLIVGFLVLVVGLGVLSGAAWARWIGIILVGLQAITNFLYIPVQPFWALTLIAIDLWVIHSLCVHRREA